MITGEAMTTPTYAHTLRLTMKGSAGPKVMILWGAPAGSTLSGRSSSAKTKWLSAAAIITPTASAMAA